MNYNAYKMTTTSLTKPRRATLKKWSMLIHEKKEEGATKYVVLNGEAQRILEV